MRRTDGEEQSMSRGGEIREGEEQRRELEGEE